MISRNVSKYIHRWYSVKNSRKYPTSNEVRQIFLNYFIDNHRHKLIKSSPVIPFCDPTVAFVNAGMNQFKSIFLGQTQPITPRATNSQKCIRVGGKHNDLSLVGRDGYHHTFFEMLGNWSFGDYFKAEACEMAWDLITKQYKINPLRLYVTYFGGDDQLNLPPDLECQEIWRSLGISNDRILPFGSKDNFWEMGQTGPCGPCTEIHIDHLPNSLPHDRAKYVNAGKEDLTELWNLVFIQYNRNSDGTVTTLPQKHIDTGMGMERLTAILQNKSSNYDTDLFMPIFDLIQKACQVPEYSGQFSNTTENSLDTSYRILADHSRMITACLSDGMFPDQNHKLRRILRQSILLSENVFKNENLLHEIIPQIAEILGETYPEMQSKLSNVLDIISYEQEIFKSLRSSYTNDIIQILSNNRNLKDIDILDTPGFVPAYKDLQLAKNTFKNNIIPGKFLFKLYDTYGLNNDSIERLVTAENLKMNIKEFSKELLNAKLKTRNTFNQNNEIDQNIIKRTMKIPDTEDCYKYKYSYNKNIGKYDIPSIKVKILAIFENDNEMNEIKSDFNGKFSIITDKTNFYYESGGQQSDIGCAIYHINNDDKIIFNIKELNILNGCVIHSGTIQPNTIRDFQLKVNDEIELVVDSNRRTKNTLHHTATHLLNAAVRTIFKKVTYQVSSSVTSNELKLELGILGYKINKDDILNIEMLVRNVINSALPINVTILSAMDLLHSSDIIMVPGEIYPETDLKLLTIIDNGLNFTSKELCCGTHALNTLELRNFSITNLKQTGRARYLFTAIAGEMANQALENGSEIVEKLRKLEININSGDEKIDSMETLLQKVKNEIQNCDGNLPYLIKSNCLEKINELSKKLRESSRTALKEFIEIEMNNLLQQSSIVTRPFIVHFLKCSSLMENVSLQKATKLCTDRPIIVISITDGMIKARCCVPKNKITKDFSAQLWLNEFGSIFKAQVNPPKGQNPDEVCNMKAKRISSIDFDDLLEIAIRKAREFASQRI